MRKNVSAKFQNAMKIEITITIHTHLQNKQTSEVTNLFIGSLPSRVLINKMT